MTPSNPKRPIVVSHRGIAWAACVIAAACIGSFAGSAPGQLVCLPLPRLLTLSPMGATAGSQVEVTISGENLDAVTGEPAGRLQFSSPGITAQPKQNADGTAVPNVYVVTVAADVPTGLHEAYVVTALGASSARVFAVGSHPEMMRSAANLSPATALALPVGTVVNAHVTPQAIDYFSVQGIGSRRIVVECAARGVESKLQPVLAVADGEGRDLVVERLGGRLVFTPPVDGTYLVKVHDLSFQGGADHSYRLVIHDWPEGSDQPQWQPQTRPVHAFSWPPRGLSDDPASEGEADATDSVWPIQLPCDIVGRFFPAADVDTFEFEAQEGDAWWIEVASHRLGSPTDVSVVVQRVVDETGSQGLEDVLELSDIPSPIKPSSNAYAYDGPPYDAGSSDVLGRLDVKVSGRYRLSLRDLFGGTRSDPSCAWRLVIRRASPDFSIVAWALHAELRNGDRNALSKPLALRAGGTFALEVAAFRRDGFDGPIDLALEGLPTGVTAEGVRVPAGGGRGYVLVTASEDAPASVVTASLRGSAEIGGTTVTHQGSVASMSWPVRDHWQEIPMPRLLPQVIVSVGGIERFPVVIAPTPRQETAEVGAPFEAIEKSTLAIPLSIRRQGELSGGSMRLKAIGAGFEGLPAFDIPLTADAHEVPVDLSKLSLPVGEHTLAFHGSVVARHMPAIATTDPKEKPQPKEIAEVLVSRPVHVRILPKPADASP